MAIASSLLLFASVVAHELCHSLVARRHGIPVRGITLFVLGGVAHITRESTRPAAEFAIAIVGPASSIVMGLGFLALSYVVEPVSIHLTVIARWLFVMNIALALFNLIPGFPLDGRSCVPGRRLGRLRQPFPGYPNSDYRRQDHSRGIRRRRCRVPADVGGVSTGHMAGLHGLVPVAGGLNERPGAPDSSRDSRDTWPGI